MFGTKETHTHIHIHLGIHLAGDTREQLTSIEMKVKEMESILNDIRRQVGEIPGVIAAEAGEIQEKVNNLIAAVTGQVTEQQLKELQGIADGLASIKTGIQGMSDTINGGAPPAPPADPTPDPATDPPPVADPGATDPGTINSGDPEDESGPTGAFGG